MAEDYPVNIVFDAIDQVTKPMRRINDRIEKMTEPVRQVNNRMRALGRESGLQRVSDAGGRVIRRLGGVRDALGQVSARVGIMGGAAAFGMQRMLSGVGRTAEELAVLKEETGASLSFMQEWQFVAERAGIPQDRLNDSLREFNGRLGELRGEGAGPLAETLKEMNPALMEQLEQTNSLEEAWSVYMSAMEQANSEQERAALASAAFSDEGRVLGNIAALGGERVAELRREAQRYGQVMGKDAVKAGREYMNAQRNLMDSFEGLSVVISGSLLPVVSDLFRKFTGWIVDNQSRVQEWSDKFADKLPGRLKRIGEVAESLFDSIKALTPVVGWLFDTFGAGNTILVTAGAIIAGPLIASLVALAPAIGTLAVTLATTPFGWFLGALAALATAVFMVYDNWDNISSFFTDKFEAVRKAFDGGLIQGVLALLREFNPLTLLVETVNGIIEYFTGVDLSKVGSQFIDSLWDGITAQWQAMTDWLQKKMDALTGWMPDWITGGTDNTTTVRDERGREQGAREQLVNGARGAVQSSSRTERSEKRVAVDFSNLPRGVRVTEEGDADDVPVNVGRSMSPAGTGM